MPTYLVERYWPGVIEPAVADALQRLEGSAATLATLGVPVRCRQTIFVPGDESVLWVFEADSAGAVERCAAEAGVAIDRLTESFEIPHRYSLDGESAGQSQVLK